ncbi:MAG: ABC transporter ATP-binding protein [Halobacteria archaeon]
MISYFVDTYSYLGIPFNLKFIIIGVSIVMTLRYSSSLVASWLSSKLKAEYVGYLQKNAYRQSLTARIGYFDDVGSDKALNTIITETKLSGQTIQKLIETFTITSMSLLYLGIALFLSPGLTVAAIVIIGGSVLGTRNLLQSGHSLGEKLSAANEKIQISAQEGAQGIHDVKRFRLEEEFISDFTEGVDSYVENTVKKQKNSAAMTNLNQLVAVISLFLVIYVGIKYTPLSLAGLGVFLFAMIRLGPRMGNLSKTFYTLESSIPHLVKTQNYIDEVIEAKEPDDGETTLDRVRNIEFDDVYFSYVSGDSSDSNDKVIDGLSLEVSGGEFISFVGQSGAGKSTIANLISRFYTPDSGEIRANELPLEEIDLESWRSRLAIVPQNPFIFNRTLRYNITVGRRDADDDEILEVCRIAKVDEFLNGLPNGLETVLGDDGVRLSGGQKQRVALARALLMDADVLLLDEATSDLDTNIESQVQKSIESMEKDYILIAIAHRLSTVKNADRIYVMEDGKITDFGTHDNLITKDGKYSDLYSQ